MNCKQGDLAIVMRAISSELMGQIVTVLRSAPTDSFLLPDGRPHHGSPINCWVVEFSRPIQSPIGHSYGVISGWHPTRFGVFSDSSLRPIRDTDGEDEVLRYAGKPQEVTA